MFARILLLLLLACSLGLAGQAPSQSFLIDLGPNDVTNGNATPSPDANGNHWTNATNSATSAAPVTLINTNGSTSDYELTVASSMSTNGINHGGLLSPSAELLNQCAIGTATQDYFFTNASGALRFTGLDPTKGYVFSLFASRNNTEVRTSGYRLTGANEVTGALQSSGPNLGGGGYNGNNSTRYVSEAVFPSAAGEILLTVTKGEGQFAYVNLMLVEEFADFGRVAVTGIEVLGDDISEQGATQRMTANVSPANATFQGVTWSVDDPTIAEITVTGELIPLKNGSVTVTATTLEPESTVSGSTTVLISGQSLTHYFIDFGEASNLTSGPDDNGNTWNNVFDAGESASAVALRTAGDDPSPLSLGITKAAESLPLSAGGLENPEAALLGELAVASATQDFFRTGNSGEITFRNLDPEAAYQIRVLGSGSHTGRRETTYEFSGFNAATGTVQTSGPDLGGAEINQNNREVYRSARVFPSDSGTITLTYRVSLGRYGYLNALRLTEYPGVQLCPTQDERGIVVMGSSVARGQGAPNDMGYAFRYGQLLNQRAQSGDGLAWELTNISVGGNNTVLVADRWARDLGPLCDEYAIYGLSLANEGIRNRGQVAFDQFSANLRGLIDRARSRNITPVVVGNYSRRDFNATDYAFIRQMNLLIHQWDVPSVNVLGTNDNGAGNWVSGYEADLGHPNDAGHEEFFYAFVPSLFDALAAGKPLPERTASEGVRVGRGTDQEPIVFEPEETVHSYTLVFDFRATERGTVATWDSEGPVAQDITIGAGGRLSYSSANGELVHPAAVTDGAWHRVAVTHYYSRGTTQLYVDGVAATGTVSERIIPKDFALAGSASPDSLGLRQLMFYRSGMNADEINALQENLLLKSSLEIYAPLDGGLPPGDELLANLAQSTNTVANSRLTGISFTPAADDPGLEVFPNPVSDELWVKTTDGRPVTRITVTDLSGRRVASFLGGRLVRLGHLPNGAYWLRVTRGEGQVTVVKLIKVD